MSKNAFIDSNSILTCVGFVAANGSDTLLAVPDDFALQPGLWKWNGSTWVAFVPPALPPRLAPGLLAALQADVSVSNTIKLLLAAIVNRINNG